MLLLVAMLSGCVTSDFDGPRTIFSFTMWLYLPVSIALASAFIAGLRMRRFASGGGIARAWGLIIGSVLLGLILLPSLLGASLELTDEGFVEHSSWWTAEPTVLTFAQVSRIELVAEASATSTKRKAFYLRCYDSVGGYKNVPISRLMAEGALEPVLERAAARGVPVHSKLGT